MIDEFCDGRKRSSKSISLISAPLISTRTPTDSSSPSLLTPPQSTTVVSLALTPPKTDEYIFTPNPTSNPTSANTGTPTPAEFAVLNFIKQRQEHRSSEPSLELVVTKLEYRNILAKIELSYELKSYVNTKLRSEYNSITQILYIPPKLCLCHEIFSTNILFETRFQLLNIANSNNNQISEFASKIRYGGSGEIHLQEFDTDDNDIQLDKDFIKYEPDQQFVYEDAEYPGVVYEIAFSQSKKNLKKKAWNYIQHSNGSIKIVVGFQLGYGKDLTAYVSVWKPRYVFEDGKELLDVEGVVLNDPFRSSDRLPLNPTKILQIPLSSFAPSEVLELDGLIPNITITYAQLAAF